MSVSRKDQKLLWGLAGARCSKCNVELVHRDDETSASTLVGEEAHIEARRKGGARFNPLLTEKERDSYHNLVLLCQPDHKLVDDNPKSYSVAYLQELKAHHEAAVRLQPVEPKPLAATYFTEENQIPVLAIRHATDLVALLEGSMQCYFEDRLENEATPEVEDVVDSLYDYIRECVDIGSFGDTSSTRRSTIRQLQTLLDEYTTNGLRLLAGKRDLLITGGVIAQGTPVTESVVLTISGTANPISAIQMPDRWRPFG